MSNNSGILSAYVHGHSRRGSRASVAGPSIPRITSRASSSALGGVLSITSHVPTPPSVSYHRQSAHSSILQLEHGVFLKKWTRRTFIRRQKHIRFFWVHTATRSVYWSKKKPNSTSPAHHTGPGVKHESITGISYTTTDMFKSFAYTGRPISARGKFSKYSFIIHTSRRDLEVAALTREVYIVWTTGLRNLLRRAAPLTTNGMVESQVPRSAQAVVPRSRIPSGQPTRGRRHSL